MWHAVMGAAYALQRLSSHFSSVAHAFNVHELQRELAGSVHTGGLRQTSCARPWSARLVDSDWQLVWQPIHHIWLIAQTRGTNQGSWSMFGCAESFNNLLCVWQSSHWEAALPKTTRNPI
jgi:hypothetical protein